MKANLSDLLQEFGYPVKDCGNYLQIPARWRDGTDNTSVAIYPKDNVCLDFVAAEKFSIETLFKRITGIDNDEDIKTFIQNKRIDLSEFKKEKEPNIKMSKVFDNKELTEDVLIDYSYWLNRGISKEILIEFNNIIKTAGRLKNRSVFPIYNEDKTKIVGMTGRSLEQNPKIPWKILGEKKNFVYPLFYSKPYIESENKVVLVESLGDGLSLLSLGTNNVLITFGTQISFSIINYLLKINPNRIYISFNNDPNLAGQNATQKAYKKLRKYFDKHQVSVKPPPEKYNDWNDYLIDKSRHKNGQNLSNK